MNKIIFRHKDFTNFSYRTLSRILFHYPWPYLIFSRRVFTFFFFLLLFLCNLPASNRCRSSTKSIRIGRKQMRLELEMDDFKMCESCCNLEKFSTPCSRYCARIKSPIFLAIFSVYVRKCTGSREIRNRDLDVYGRILDRFCLIRGEQY